MIRARHFLFIAATAFAFSSALAAPSVYPTGTTIFDPGRAWSGYTVLSLLSTQAVVVIDMNGRVVKRWEDFNNSAGGPARIMPDGSVIAAHGARPPHQESLELIRRDFDGNVIWRLDENVRIRLADGEVVRSLRQHHDWQRADMPAGYYSPEATPGASPTRYLVLTHSSRMEANVADVLLEDDRLIEVDESGALLWQWVASDHIDEFRFDSQARETIRNAPGFSRARGSLDWFHINSATWVGPNRWYDEGDERFDPQNVVISSRQASIVAIVARDGSVVWQLGPDFSRGETLRDIGQVIGQHHAHIVPEGLPGAGNMLIFDNGGSSGYGAPSAIAPNGLGIYARATSRVLEINPVTLELVWSYQAPNFFSTNISSAQRLPNGNTLITEGAPGRIFEVTADRAIVWEYMSPFFGGPRSTNSVYRAYRLPYEWIPQLRAPEEVAVAPPPLEQFRLP